MRDKSKVIFRLIIGIIVISLGYNLYQINKINKYKEKASYSLRTNIQRFTSYGGNIEDEEIYAGELMFKISDDIEDKESISKVYKLLN